MTIAMISVYIVGCVISYLFYRWVYSDEWTVAKRTMYIIVCLFSWANLPVVIIHFLYNLFKANLNNNNKAKW